MEGFFSEEAFDRGAIVFMVLALIVFGIGAIAGLSHMLRDELVFVLKLLGVAAVVAIIFIAILFGLGNFVIWIEGLF